MAYFKDAQEVYDTLGKLFQDLVTDDELAPKFRQANTIVRYEYSEPESAITVRLQDGQPGEVDLVPLTKPVFPRYKAQLERQGRTNLIDA